MKKIVFILILILFHKFVISQKVHLNSCHFDSLLSVNLPGEISSLDTTVKGIELHQMVATKGNSIYLFQKTPLEKEDLDENLSGMPYDSAGLEKIYEDFIVGFSNALPGKMKSKAPVFSNKIKGYQIQYIDSMDIPIYQATIYLLNKSMYVVSQFNLQGIESADSKSFFNSLTIHNESNIKQLIGKPQSYRIGYLIGKYALFILIAGGLVVFFARRF